MCHPTAQLVSDEVLYCCMDKFTITAEDGLIFHYRQHQVDGEWEVRPGLHLPPACRLTHAETLDMGYTRRYPNERFLDTEDDSFADYVVPSPTATSEWIRHARSRLSEIHKKLVFAKD